jgi:hypothetical protein
MAVSHQLSVPRKRGGWTVSFVLHILLLLLALFPFAMRLPEPELPATMVIQFEYEPSLAAEEQQQQPVIDEFTLEDAEGKMSGADAAAASSSEGSEGSSAPQESRELITPTTVSRIAPSTSMPTPSRSVVTSDVEPTVVVPQSKSTNTTRDNFFNQPVETSDRYEVDRVEFSSKYNPAMQQKVTWHVVDRESSREAGPGSFDDLSSRTGAGKGNSTGNGTGGTGRTGNAPDGQSEDGGYDPFGDGSFPGEGNGTGKGNKGSNTGYGNDGKGLKWGDFAGDGIFGRKVIKRADVAKIAVKQGKIVVNLCVDQMGKVTVAKFDNVNSTIKDQAIATKAVESAKQYVFDEDPSAPREQCGRLTFVFEIEK